MSDAFKDIIGQLREGRHLTREQTAAVFERIMSGALGEEQIEQFLAALADLGETVDELVGAAEVMRRHVTRVPCDDPRAVDTCGTGGDGISTFNVSTAAAVVAAAAGACVAKHGNRTNTRKSGSAEVLAALGVNIDAEVGTVARCLREIRLGFLYAARLHPAMRHAAAARKKLARRTIFNLLGPLTNPAGVRRQVIGVASPDLLPLVAEALRRLGAEHAFVVHGHDGLCDLTITGPSSYIEVRHDACRAGSLRPENVGLAVGDGGALRVGGPEESAAAIRAILAGEPGPRRGHTLLNAAATLVAASVAMEFDDGVRRAAAAIDSGAASETLTRLIALSHETT